MTEYRLWAPPAHLLADCPVTEWIGGDWAGVADLAEARRQDVERCNTDKRLLREALRDAKQALVE